KSRAVSPEQPRSQPTPHPCPSCKSGLCHSHRVAIIVSRPDIVFVGLTCDACGHQWTIEKPIDVSKSDKASLHLAPSCRPEVPGFGDAIYWVSVACGQELHSVSASDSARRKPPR